MALQLRSKFTRILNLNPNPYLPKSFSTSGPDSGDVCRSVVSNHPDSPPLKDLKNFVEKLLTFDEEKVKVDDRVSVRKRMLAKMRDEWKAFRDGGRGCEVAEFGKKEKRDWSVEIGEVAEKEMGDDRRIEIRGVLEEVDADGDGDWGLELGEAREAEEKVSRTKEVNDAKDSVFARKMVDKEGMIRSMEEKESGCWTLELGEVEEEEAYRGGVLPKMKIEWNAASDGAVGIGNDSVRESQRSENEKGERQRRSQMRNKKSSNLGDTLHLLKTVKKKMTGKEAEFNAVSKKSMTLDDERNKRVGFAKGVNNEELQDKLKKLQNDLDEEKKQLSLYRDELVEDCLQKLHSGMLEEEKQITSKFNEVLKETLQKLQHEVEDERRRIKSSFNELLMKSYSKLHMRFREERERLISSYNNNSSDSS